MPTQKQRWTNYAKKKATAANARGAATKALNLSAPPVFDVLDELGEEVEVPVWEPVVPVEEVSCESLREVGISEV